MIMQPNIWESIYTYEGVLAMDEIEFARNVAGKLNERTRENVLQSLQLQGFRIDGFRNMQKVPVKMLQASLRKPIGRSKKSTASVFLKEVKECTIDDPVIKIVNLWFGSEEEKAIAEKRIVNEQSRIGENTKSVITEKTDNEKHQAMLADVNLALETQRKKNKQLQQKIQGLKKQLEDINGDLNVEKKLNEKLTQENSSLKETNDELMNQYSKCKSEIEEYKKQNNELEEKIKFIESALQKRPKILCFTKRKISKEYIYIYNIEVHSDLSNLEDIDWKQYKRIFISESDFPIDKIQMIGTISGKHVDQARNIKKIIERII